MPVSDETKKGASKARGWLSKILPRKKKKTIANQGYLGRAARQIQSRRRSNAAMLEEASR